MTELARLPRPDMEYISKGPYTCTLEWCYDDEPDDLFHATSDTMLQGLKMFWTGHPSLRSNEGSPDRRVLFDVRGVAVLGSLVTWETTDWVATFEALDLMEELGGDPADLIELRISCIYANEMQS